MEYVCNDQYLLIFKWNGSVTILNVADGTVVGELFMDSALNSGAGLIREDFENQYLCIFAGSATTTGYLIDVKTWTVIAEIPGLVEYLEQSNRIVQKDYLTGMLTVTPLYTCDELMSLTRLLLDMAETNALG